MSDSDLQTSVSNSQSTSSRGERIANIGMLVSAVMASSCCWLPLVLLAMGVSGVGIASTLEAYRPVFLVVTFGFLGAAFYVTYRPRKAAAGIGNDGCASQPTAAVGCCATTGKRRFNMNSMNKMMLWLVTILAVTLMLFPSYIGALLATGDGKDVTAEMNRAVLKVDGMTCEGCSALVADAIRDVPGVLAVEVDFNKGEVVVGAEACCPVPKDRIVVALEKAGYGGNFVVDSAVSIPGSPTEAKE